MRKLVMMIAIGSLSVMLAQAAGGRRADSQRRDSRASGAPCDTDPANDEFLLGTVTVPDGKGGTLNQFDACKGKQLAQWNCSAGKKLSAPSFTLCQYGCSMGVCLPPPPTCVDSDETTPNQLLVPGAVNMQVSGAAVEPPHLDKCFLDPPQLQMIGEAVCNADHTGWMPTLQPCPPGTQCQLNGSGVAFCGKITALNVCTDLNPAPDLQSPLGVSYVWSNNPAMIVPNTCFADATAGMADAIAKMYPQFADKKGATVLDMGCQDTNKDGVPDTPTLPTPVLCPPEQVCKSGVCQDAPPPDQDGDGVSDNQDNCPLQVNGGQTDGDQDGVGDVCDNCLVFANADQADGDQDGVGDLCEYGADSGLCPVGHVLTVGEISTDDIDGNGIYDSCEYPQYVDWNDADTALSNKPLYLDFLSARISENGRFVAFHSGGDNLVEQDTNGKMDIFVRDRWLKQTERVSFEVDGGESAGHNDEPFISMDGRFITYRAFGPTGGGNYGGVRLFDRLSKKTTVVSQHSSNPASASVDGLSVVFTTVDKTLGGFTGHAAVLWNQATQQYTPLVTIPAAWDFPIAVSAGAQRILYRPYLSTPMGKYSPPVPHLQLYDQQKNATTDLSEEMFGALADNVLAQSNPFANSGDGMIMAFASKDAAVPGDTNGNSDVYVYDMPAKQLTRISVGFDGSEASGHSYRPRVSYDGRYVVFLSSAVNLVAESNGNAFVHDRKSGMTATLFAKGPGNADYLTPEISPDGRFVTYFSGNHLQITVNPLWQPPAP